MARNKKIIASTTASNMLLAKSAGGDATKVKSMLIEIAQQSQSLTKKDIKSWRNAWQTAINADNPLRTVLYSIYVDVDTDLHITGAISQRKGEVKKKSFKVVDAAGKENPEITELFEAKWFKSFVDLALDARYWGHSLIQLGDVVEINGKMRYKDSYLVPRLHVRPEHGVIVKEQSDDWQKGFNYREGPLSQWCIEAGNPFDLGLFLKLAPHQISKKNMAAFWDQFGELFGMPIRIGKTTTRDQKERSKIEAMLTDMGAAAWGLFPEGTEIEVKESTKGDAFNVYDKRIERCNSEMSKGILNQTMTIDNGSSLSQSATHLDVFENVVEADADMIRDLVNDELIPRMLLHGFPVQNMRFNWDESVDYTPEQQVAIESMIMANYDVDPQYFVDKYNIKILGKKEVQPSMPLAKGFFD